MTSPPRYLPTSEWQPSDFARHQRDSSYRPESPAYIEARAKALAAAGFESEPVELDFDSMSPEQLADLTPEQHHERISRRQ